MVGKKTQNIQVWSSLNPVTDKKLNQWAARLGMSKSMLVNLCVQAGIDQVVRVFAPEEALADKKIASIIKELMKSGDLSLPAGVKVPAKRPTTK